LNVQDQNTNPNPRGGTVMEKITLSKMYNHAFLGILCLALLSCDGSQIITGDEEATVAPVIEQAGTPALQQAKQATPAEVSAAFFEMEEKVKNMSSDELLNLSEKEILKLGEPIRLATEGTIKLSERTLNQLRRPLKELTDRFLTMTREEHRVLSREIDNIITSDGLQYRRSLTTDQIRDLLMELSGETMYLSSTCEQMFTMQGDRVILMPGDNFNLANHYCPAGTPFIVTSGIHTQQYVLHPKQNNSWLGGGSSSIMDGQNSSSVSIAFYGIMTDISLSSFKIRKYTDYGIFSDSGFTKNIIINSMTFKNIGAGKTGEFYGAIRFDNTKNIRVQYSYFENVTSSVRFRYSDGPLRVLNNEALNTGRNFFQCVNCTGSDIIINNNSLEHTTKFGLDDLEDFINIFQSNGATSSNRLEVNQNRARTNATGSGVSKYGSFIILGDRGGVWQKAESNIGVNTGNVGIGAAGGEDIQVNTNKMLSIPIENLSNVAFYSYRYQGNEPCGNHSFSGNVAHWRCHRPDLNCTVSGTLNRATAPEFDSSPIYCGLTDSDINHLTRVAEDTSMGPEIWNEW